MTPTLTVATHFLRHDRLSVREEVAAAAAGQLRALREAGGTVLFGTDLGAVDADPRPEYAALASAGMGFREVLASLTTDPAAHFGGGERTGRLAPGFQADVTVAGGAGGDPALDPCALADVRWTVRSGNVVYVSV